LDREELLKEPVENKFIRYAQVDTESNDEVETIPSSEGQWQLLKMLRDELMTVGVENPELTKDGILLAQVPGRTEAPPIGFLAHVDTAPGVSGKHVKPQIHHNYQGGDLTLAKGVVIRESDSPALRRVVGHDLITSDGSTLLGADDKAGVAAIMAAVCRWMAEPERPRPLLKLAFTPDEETGRGIHRLDPKQFEVYCAYTIDGGEGGELEAENFNAANFDLVFRGVNSHTGDARGRMVNALQMAAEFILGIPAGQRPETTDDALGFLHPNAVKGGVEEAVIQILVRDFDREQLNARIQWMKGAGRAIAAKYPGAKVSLKQTGGYLNMHDVIAKDPRIVELATRAYQNAGVEPVLRRIRGGTDGAVLSEKGIPMPNLFTGGVNFHSRTEWLSIPWLRQSVQAILELAALWAINN
jgi:tripeptide aminopeptidase